MRGLEIEDIKNKFYNRLKELTKREEKENETKVNLILSLFFLSLIFSTITAYVSISNYHNVKTNESQVNEIIKVKVNEVPNNEK